MKKIYEIKQQSAVNLLLLFLCVLLLGFVYLNNMVIDQFYADKHNASANQTNTINPKDAANEQLLK